MKKLYAALVVSASLVICLEVVIGYTSAIVIPKGLFDYFGSEIGLFFVNLFTITLPYFFVSMALLPLLGFIAQSETFKYSFITLGGFESIAMLRYGDMHTISMHYLLLVPFIAGIASILLAGWIIGKRYQST